jgi:hypothetical protein
VQSHSENAQLCLEFLQFCTECWWFPSEMLIYQGEVMRPRPDKFRPSYNKFAFFNDTGKNNIVILRKNEKTVANHQKWYDLPQFLSKVVEGINKLWASFKKDIIGISRQLSLTLLDSAEWQKNVETRDHFKNGASPKSLMSRKIKEIKNEKINLYVLSNAIVFYFIRSEDVYMVSQWN